MLNDKAHYGKSNNAYTLVSSDGHRRADDQITHHVATC